MRAIPLISYLYMKLLEKRPQWYDSLISLFNFKKEQRLKEWMVNQLTKTGDRILDIGTGTGEMAFKFASRASHVVGIDISPEMLAVAKKKKKSITHKNNIDFIEAGIGELSDRFSPSSFDVVVISLVLSELNEKEQHYTLQQAAKLLTSKGIIIIRDEILPPTRFKQVIYHIIRTLMALWILLLRGGLTYPIQDIHRLITVNGFIVQTMVYPNWLHSHCIVQAAKISE